MSTLRPCHVNPLRLPQGVALRVRAWVALLAMVVLTLLPTVSQALAALDGRSGAALLAGELCSVASPATADGGQSPAADPVSGSMPAAQHLQHCAACLMGVDALGPPPAPAAAARLVRAAPAPLPADLAAPAPAPAHRRAQPRAPPALT
ncbi:MAG: hypothetical protein RL722_2513 [Pseudomonadota bacterium]